MRPRRAKAISGPVAALLPVQVTQPDTSSNVVARLTDTVEILLRHDPGPRADRCRVAAHGAGLPGCAGVIGPPGGTRIWLAAGVTDLRRGMYGLAALLESTLTGQVYDGDVFVFRGRRGDLIKVLWADRDGLCLFAKRLERGPVRVAAGDLGHGASDTGAVVDAARGH